MPHWLILVFIVLALLSALASLTKAWPWALHAAVVLICIVLLFMAVGGARAQDVVVPAPAPVPVHVTTSQAPAPAANNTTELVILAVSTFASVLAKMLIDHFTNKRAAEKIDDVKKAAEGVAADLATSKAEKVVKNAQLDAKLDQAVSTATMQVRLSAMQARRIAELTKDPQDIAAADLAERLLAEQSGKPGGAS